MWYAKCVAASKHALVTLLVALLASVLVFGVWFPGYYSEIMAGIRLFLLIIAVEVVLGPCMSLVIYNPLKPKQELVRDYLIIAAVQLSALGYGLHTVAGARPVFVVFVKDRLEVVSAVDVDSEDLELAELSQYKSLPWWGPELVCTRESRDAGEQSQLISLSVFGGKDMQVMPKYYRPCNAGELSASAKPLSQLRGIAEGRDNKAVLAAIEVQWVEADTYRWLPVMSRFGVWSVLVNVKNDELEKYLSFDPF